MHWLQSQSWFLPLQRFLHLRFAGIPVAQLFIALIVAALAFVFLLCLRRALKAGLSAWAARTVTDWDDLLVELIAGTRTYVLLALSLYPGLLLLPLGPHWATAVDCLGAIPLVFQIGLWGNRIIDFAITRAVARRSEPDSGLNNAAGALKFLSRIALWSLVALLILGSLKINITALVAGLGVGGVAVALALQNILGDLFASLSILIDKPFAVGHFIVVDNLSGTVEHVGVKSTRVRSLSGEEIVLSNGDLLKSRIHNYKKLLERRILFAFGVTYDTPYEKMAAIPAMVREIIEALPKTRFDRAHFKEFGDSSLNFEVVYFVLDSDYNLYMDIQQQINLALFRRFAQEAIEFAFPTRTLYVASPDGASSSEATAQTSERSSPSDGSAKPDSRRSATGLAHEKRH